MTTRAASPYPSGLRLGGPDPTLLAPFGGGATSPAWPSVEVSPWVAPVPRDVPSPAPEPPPARGVLVVGAHGGCGATTLAQHLPAAREVLMSSLLASGTPSPVSGVRVCVVTAATPDGTAASSECLHRLHAAGCPTEALFLALVSDGRGPVPASVRARTRLLRPAVADMHLLPHVQRWRYEDRSTRTPSRKYTRALEGLWTALARHPAGAVHPTSPGGPARTSRPSAAAPTLPALPAYPLASATSTTFPGEAARRW